MRISFRLWDFRTERLRDFTTRLWDFTTERLWDFTTGLQEFTTGLLDFTTGLQDFTARLLVRNGLLAFLNAFSGICGECSFAKFPNPSGLISISLIQLFVMINVANLQENVNFYLKNAIFGNFVKIFHFFPFFVHVIKRETP